MSRGCYNQTSHFYTRLNRACKLGINGYIVTRKITSFGLKQEIKDMDKVETLCLRPVTPFERHEKIFAMWDSLKSGETLKITNAYGPKLLHYQFEVAHKDKYE